MAAQRGDRLDVSLDAGTAGGIEARQYQYLGASIEFDGAAP
ncbi:hypothetical protein [Marinobacter salinexigens]|nr:hypothetical protein [Marinobacter salinexigens]